MPNPSFETGGGKADLDIFTIGVTCSGGMSYKATEQYKKLQNMPISKMFYRGDGWPGKNCLISSDGNKIEYVHNGSLFERMFSSQIFKNPGVKKTGYRIFLFVLYSSRQNSNYDGKTI